MYLPFQLETKHLERLIIVFVKLKALIKTIAKTDCLLYGEDT